MTKYKLFFCTTFLIILLVSCSKEPKTAYVVMQELFEGFDGKKELEQELSLLQSNHTKVLDSLKLVFLSQSEEKKIQTQQKYNQLAQNFSYVYQQKSTEYDQQIWKQINEYIHEYGKKNKYKYLFGADGTGTIMYADSTSNITKDVLKFINTKYGG